MPARLVATPLGSVHSSGQRCIVHLLNRPDGLRHSGSSRLAFQIWPQAAQRQYVKALTSLLVVLTLTELQKGQLLGAVVSGFVYIPIMQPGMSPGTA
jgi:hypothetical protein